MVEENVHESQEGMWHLGTHEFRIMEIPDSYIAKVDLLLCDFSLFLMFVRFGASSLCMYHPALS